MIWPTPSAHTESQLFNCEQYIHSDAFISPKTQLFLSTLYAVVHCHPYILRQLLKN